MKKTSFKLLSAVLSLALAGGIFAACSPKPEKKADTTSDANSASKTVMQSDAGSEESSPAEGSKSASGGEEMATGKDNIVIVGDNTMPDSNMCAAWTSTVTNVYARELMFATGGTQCIDQDAIYQLNPGFAKSIERTEDADGNIVFTTTINPEAKFNDGSPITVDDYLTAILVKASNAIHEIDNFDIATNSVYKGFEEWQKDNTKPWTGIRRLSDTQFSVTVLKDEESYYINDMAVFAAWPKKVVLPDTEIKDDGEGCYFASEVSKATLDTINSTDGYRYKPMVTPGAYSFVSFDNSKKEIVFKANPYYPGNFEGIKPRIETIVIRYVPDTTLLDSLKSGGIDMTCNLNGGTTIKQGIAIAKESDGRIETLDFPRCGYGKVAFSCDFGPTQFEDVRHAIAYLLDRPTFLNQYTGGYGVLVNGAYGQSQWEYNDNKDAIESELNQYPFNVEKAKELLIKDGWTKNKDGGDYVEGEGIRYKEVDGKLMPLEIQWLNTPSNPVSDLLNTMLPGTMEQVGMKLVPTTQDFNVLINHLYRQGIEKPIYHMFNLGTGFTNGRNEAWYTYSTDPGLMGNWNTNFITDPKLEAAAEKMRTSKSNEEWSKNWLAFQKEWNRALPDLPLYSDQYYVFYDSNIRDLEVNPVFDYAWALPLAYKTKG